MAFTSIGYGLTVDQVAWSALGPSLGTPPGVLGASDFALTVIGGTDRTCYLEPGTAFGYGIRDTTAAGISLTPDALSGGGARWDALVLRRDWAAKTTTAVLVKGAAGGSNTTPVLPSGLQNQPGVVTDQLLWLTCTVPKAGTGGAVSLTTVQDYRAWWSPSVFVRGLNAAPVGLLGLEANVRSDTGTETWRREVGSGGAGQWSPVSKPGFVWDDVQGAWYRERYDGISTQTLPANARQVVLNLNSRFGARVIDPSKYLFRADMYFIAAPSTGTPPSVSSVSSYSADGAYLTLNLANVTAGGSTRFAWSAVYIGDI